MNNRLYGYLMEWEAQDFDVAPSPARDWSQTSKTDRMNYVMQRLVQNYGFPVNGAAGLVGNLYAESELIPNRIEGSSASTPMRARDFTERVTDFTAQQIMNRNYSARQGPKLPGVGLAQWTTQSRRVGLFQHSYNGRPAGEAILFDMDAQIDYLVNELKTQYSQVYNILKNSTVTAEAASDEVVYSFEIPGAILSSGSRLPKSDARVQEVFKKRRIHAREALASYQPASQPGGLPAPAGPAAPGAPVRGGSLDFLKFLFGIPQAIVDLLQRGQEYLAIPMAIGRGIRDENKLTNMIFFSRHSERNGRKLSRSEPQFAALSREWLQIRDRVVRPALRAAQSAPSGGPMPGPLPRPPVTPPSTGATGAIPPVEGPVKGILSTSCSRGSGRCWTARARDIIDPGAPWNTPDRRSPASYIAVLEYLNVDNKANFRYTDPTGAATFCNIYMHDATRMMWASIPHWVPDRRQKSGFNELTANATQEWMEKNSRSIGWVEVDDRFCRWIQEQSNRRQSLPFSDPSVPPQVLAAGARVAAGNHPNPALLAQPGYVAQQFANLGLPAVIIWKKPSPCRDRQGNLRKRCIGHVAMIRPETPGSQGKVIRGVFVPRSAQAGRNNFRNGLADWILGKQTGPSRVRIYVHA